MLVGWFPASARSGTSRPRSDATAAQINAVATPRARAHAPGEDHRHEGGRDPARARAVPTRDSRPEPDPSPAGRLGPVSVDQSSATPGLQPLVSPASVLAPVDADHVDDVDAPLVGRRHSSRASCAPSSSGVDLPRRVTRRSSHRRVALGRPLGGSIRRRRAARDGRPVVIENEPHLRDGTPMPTLYWLVDPEIARRR